MLSIGRTPVRFRLSSSTPSLTVSQLDSKTSDTEMLKG